MYYVYILIDPRDGLVRYVGCTSSLSTRYYFHRNNLDKSSPRKAWIADLLENGEYPIIEVVEELDISRYYDRERFWITHFLLDLDQPILNRSKIKRENFYDISYYDLYRKGESEEVS